MYNIAVIPGDGIGEEVVKATTTVLDKLDVEFNYTHAIAGDKCKEETGVPLPEETIQIAKESDAVLFGAAGETAADVIVRLRHELNTFVNLRPVKSLQPEKYGNIDFMIVRENTEDLYIGDEEETPEGAIARKKITKAASDKISEYAFQYAKDTGRKKVTAVHKANVLKISDGLFKKCFYEVAEKYPEIESNDFYVDATAMYLITNPLDFEVIVTSNLYGDILSDEGAGLVGGLGMIPSANIGDENGLFEPVHGSAPDIAGQGIANPVATILSACMMLDYLGESDSARKIENIIVEVIQEGKVVTPDLGGTASTQEMAEYIASKI
ncbi:isocitrate/isopropylmalate family dehydrogenase [Methanosphaera sp.]|uniref:isocitrate/isopropylmalate family dehydrogenase n=1 Tax=Methanosphaera sp. TaxID=2666342 RepID=UPI0025F41732|nr:isocitrate/isopropylmalate family dehydrogenase [Methanosphaera sp.]MEE1117139.1 isocitrate/isopropylmalate family dehydrogenase [Methanosphaera sp.]MEE3324133.1 isocitrate/isopropylmalate family dehydrogenase [Methanosphaera sp.]MEE3417828.1 isocitrate/isopropylmalate family dehydrogenase [Methanosphaera sp.]